MWSTVRILPALGSLLLPAAIWGQDPFQNPPELAHQGGHLKAVIQLKDAVRFVPNGPANTTYRMFQGWGFDDKAPKAVPDAAKTAPGPTLRGRVGGRIDIMYLNAVDEKQFPYTTDGLESPGSSDCDQRGQYPPTSGTITNPAEQFPDCFHGSSTSNMHFHGTHTSPDGVGDNVLIQVIPKKDIKPEDFRADFDAIFRASKPPQRWRDMPEHYQVTQLGYKADEIIKAAANHQTLTPKGWVADYDVEQAKRASGAGKKPPQSLWQADFQMVASGQWPQFVLGAFPNALEIPDYKDGRGGLRAGQAPGTHWYHAHKHGSTSLHIFNGLAGALIIEGDYDDKLHAFFDKQRSGKKMTEQVLVFQQIVASQNLERVGGDNPSGGNNQKLINGIRTPTFTMAPGEIQLWRFVNAMGGGGKGTLDFTLFQAMLNKGFEISQVAYDGVQFSWDNYLLQPFFSTGRIPMPSGYKTGPVVKPGLTLAAGNRADLLIKAPSTPGLSVFEIPGDINAPTGTPFAALSVNVTGTAENMRFFSAKDKDAYPKFPAFLADLPEPPAANKRTLEFSATSGPGGPTASVPQFTIDGKRFALTKEGTPVGPDARVDQCQKVNTLWDWTLTNTSKASVQVHPFHIHINPFQILEIKYKDAQNNLQTWTPTGQPVWSDVVSIPVGGSVKIRQAFYDFTGTYVLHCHILAHEDRGMMQLVRTIPANANEDQACKLNGVQHH